MRRIRANAIAILTVAWILGTFYYLWQDNKPQSASHTRGRNHGQKLVPGRLEIHRDDRTIPLIVSGAAAGGGKLWGGKERDSTVLSLEALSCRRVCAAC